MASQLDNSKYQASKFSSYDDAAGNHPPTPQSLQPAAGLNFVQHHQQLALFSNSYGPRSEFTSLNDSLSKPRDALSNQNNSPAPMMQQKQMPFKGHYPSSHGTTTPDTAIQDYKDILDEQFASPRAAVKPSQPLVNKNLFMSYISEQTTDVPLSPKISHLKYTNSNSVAV